MDAHAQTPGAPAFRGQHQVKPLPFDPGKLNGLSEKLIRSHWENNYQGAVRALNAVEQRLDAMLKDKDLPPYLYGDLKREELVRTGSLVLHEYYFANLGGDGKPLGEIANAINQSFGSREQWELEFKRTANALGGGSGWVILTYNPHTSELLDDEGPDGVGARLVRRFVAEDRDHRAVAGCRPHRRLGYRRAGLGADDRQSGGAGLPDRAPPASAAPANISLARCVCSSLRCGERDSDNRARDCRAGDADA